ncbi:MULTISPECIES: hypothetical protein [Paraburkholderia]|uniref:Transmembrane protein n=1 Tax=Paraburkholderia ferrariae TaxID=386056 RepID=A0ABU9RTB8_9BURK
MKVIGRSFLLLLGAVLFLTPVWMTVQWFEARRVFELAAIAIVVLVMACRAPDRTALRDFYLVLIFAVMFQAEMARDLIFGVVTWSLCGIGCLMLRRQVRQMTIERRLPDAFYAQSGETGEQIATRFSAILDSVNFRRDDLRVDETAAPLCGYIDSYVNTFAQIHRVRDSAATAIVTRNVLQAVFGARRGTALFRFLSRLGPSNPPGYNDAVRAGAHDARQFLERAAPPAGLVVLLGKHYRMLCGFRALTAH